MAAKKKIVPRTRKDRRKKQSPSIFTEIKKILVGIAILVFVGLVIAMSVDIFLAPHRLEKKGTMVQDQPGRVEKPIQIKINDSKG
ncbi:MAG: hypothetical protein KKD21_07510, partial [Proteobacteria bacterium]|nr:hypothetical protein [Pseudomonadota bacterium]MBU1696877.1 hypothetical protein [Pseudomonadota bacterium]